MSFQKQSFQHGAQLTTGNITGKTRRSETKHKVDGEFSFQAHWPCSENHRLVKDRVQTTKILWKKSWYASLSSEKVTWKLHWSSMHALFLVKSRSFILRISFSYLFLGISCHQNPSQSPIKEPTRFLPFENILQKQTNKDVNNLNKWILNLVQSKSTFGARFIG